MELRTSAESKLTETVMTPPGVWKDFGRHGWGDGLRTAGSLPGVTMLFFDSRRAPRRSPLRIVIDTAEEERKRATRLRNGMARGEPPATQDSSTPALPVEGQDQDIFIESLGPIRRFRVNLLIRNVRKAEPPEIDPSWVL